MSFLKTTYQRKSFWLTSFILAVIFLLLFFFGLRYLDPPIENGILIAFGSEQPGNIEMSIAPEQPTEVSQEITLPNTQAKAVQTPAETLEPSQEEVLVSETSEVVVANKSEPTAIPELDSTPIQDVIPEPVSKPKEASDATKAALANILGATEVSGSGIGSSDETGNQGLSDGSLYSNSYYGSAQGSPNGLGFGLAGRSLVGKGSVTPDCNEQGRVVVAITVDPSGNVIAADAGVRGTTNNAPCLLKPATATAFMYKWAPDPKAPAKQLGFVVINFKLGQ